VSNEVRDSFGAPRSLPFSILKSINTKLIIIYFIFNEKNQPALIKDLKRKKRKAA